MQNFLQQFYDVFIKEDLYKRYLHGLSITLQISLLAVILGIFLGVVLALMRLSTWKIGRFNPLSSIAGAYIDVIRGTPVVLQLMIFSYVIFGGIRSTNPNLRTLIGALAFGCNSAAYVAEIVRGGILSVDRGQTEAGRSLGLSGSQTMRLVIMPQAAKNIIPALGNELIVLIKETSIVGYIGGVDLTKVGDQIRTKTYIVLPPLLIVALIYYIVIKLLTYLMRRVERRLRESDIR